MKKKKIWSSLSRIVIAMLFISSWAVLGIALALKTAKVEIGGGITFDATDVYAKITGTVSGNKTDITLPDITLDANTSSDYSDLADEFDAWSSIDLAFPNAKSKITLSITVQNLSGEVPFWVYFEDGINASNTIVTRKSQGTEVSEFSTVAVPVSSTKTFAVEFEVAEKNNSVDGTWNLGLNLLNEMPTEVSVSNASDLVTALQSSVSQSKAYTAITLTQDIDLTSLNSQFTSASSSMFINSFKGEIDGNGKTITMNSEARNNYSSIFKSIEGYFHDFTLHFPNIENKEINFANVASGDTIFENITTTGSITITGGTNWSPYVNFFDGDITFKNCTNSLNVVNENTYGSLFVGGYCRGTGSLTMETTNSSGQTITRDYGIVDGVKVAFINCKNTANVRMKQAGFLWGNTFKLPKMENLTIINCVNEGTILGDQHADLFAANRNDEEAYSYMRPYFNFGDYAIGGTKTGLFATVGDNLKNDNGGICTPLTRKNMAGLVGDKFKITSVTSGHKYKIEFGFGDIEYNSDNEITGTTSVKVIKEFTATSSDAIDTGFYNYDFIYDYEYNALSSPTTTEISASEGWEVYVAGAHPYKAYLVTAGDKSYYYVDVLDIDNRIEKTDAFVSISVYEYDADGNILAYQNLGGWDEGVKIYN